MQVIKTVLVLTMTYLSGKSISKSLSKLYQKTLFPENVENIIMKVSKYAIYIIGAFVAIAFLGFDLTSLIFGLGAFSISISFATTTIIQNLISGRFMQSDKAFQIGGRIVTQGIEGTAAKIGVRATVIETNEHHWLYIPNALFMTNLVARKNQEETRLQES
jgi:small-conductance mechanosensitive channel